MDQLYQRVWRKALNQCSSYSRPPKAITNWRSGYGVCLLEARSKVLIKHLFLRAHKQRWACSLTQTSDVLANCCFFFFFLSLWIYLWLAETSQQPISQTTWLKVTPHCNHCNHCCFDTRFAYSWTMSAALLKLHKRPASSLAIIRPLASTLQIYSILNCATRTLLANVCSL